MKDISGLADSLKGYLGWNKARMNCFVHMLLGLFAVRTINLTEIALAMDGNTCNYTVHFHQLIAVIRQ